MIQFKCSYCWEPDETDDWEGVIKEVNNYTSHYEFAISSRSHSFNVLVGKSKLGLFACIPHYEAGCQLSTLNDIFFNTERLIYAMEDPVAGTTVACALNALSDILKFE